MITYQNISSCLDAKSQKCFVSGNADCSVLTETDGLYTETGDNLIIEACGITHDVYYRYRIGSDLYNLELSRKGKLEKITIKSVSVIQGIAIYKDTFNDLWNEEDFCSFEDAVNNAIDYYQARDAEVDTRPEEIHHPFSTTYLYSNGDILYNLELSRKGKLEKITIKSVMLNNNIPIYKDTFNDLWNEEDFCSFEDAVNNAIDYYESL